MTSPLAFALLLSVAAPGTAPVVADEALSAPIAQTLVGFDRPESCAFSLDGKFLFVGHCGSDLFGPERKKVGFVRGRGAVSKLAVAEDGTVRMSEARLATGLDGSLGLAVLPKATARYPAGTLLVACGLALSVEPDGASVTDAKALGTSIVFLDPDSGARLGVLDLGVGSAIAEQLGHALLMPNSLAFDELGNLYVSDSARGGDRLEPALEPHPGIVRIAQRAIDDPAAAQAAFVPIPGIPNGIAIEPKRAQLLVVTMGGDVPGGKDVYALDLRQIPADEAPEPWKTDVGTMDGVAVTPAGTVIVSRFSGDLYAIPRGRAAGPILLQPDTPLVAPADHRLWALPDGSCLLAVPEQARNELPAGEQRVRIVRLPPGF